MAHFAKLDKNNKVIDVIVVDNNDIENLDFPQSEAVGISFIKNIGIKGKFLQTSYNHNFRKNFAEIGSTYLPEQDIFIPPSPYPSWKLDENYDWISPVPQPQPNYDPRTQSYRFSWNEELMEWEETIIPINMDETLNED